MTNWQRLADLLALRREQPVRSSRAAAEQRAMRQQAVDKRAAVQQAASELRDAGPQAWQFQAQLSHFATAGKPPRAAMKLKPMALSKPSAPQPGYAA